MIIAATFQRIILNKSSDIADRDLDSPPPTDQKPAKKCLIYIRNPTITVESLMSTSEMTSALEIIIESCESLFNGRL